VTLLKIKALESTTARKNVPAMQNLLELQPMAQASRRAYCAAILDPYHPD
jgi:hypothetical protein